jgi:uncharacterized protein YndB with AHSA1/START domain
VASAETKAVAEAEVRIGASPEVVFEFLVDPDKMIQWMGRSAVLEPRPGGRFHVDINGRDVASGEYVVLEPPSRLVFTWGWEGEGATIEPGGSTIEMLLEPDGDGTHLRLIHSDLPGSDAAQKHGLGWEHYLARLSTLAAGGDPGADPWTNPEAAPSAD